MRKLALAFAPVVWLVATPASAQTATSVAGAASRSTSVGVGVGVGVANASSGGAGGSAQASGNGNSSLTVNGSPPVTTSNVITSGTSTVKNVPAVFAPGLAAAGLETCLGSVSGGAAAVGFGASFGTTVPDPGCAARLDARTLWSFGLKQAALARLCLTPDIYRSMPDICYRYMPRQPAGYAYGPAPIVLSTTEPVELIDGKTGRPRTCNDYNAERQHCRVWADGAVRMAQAAPHKKRSAAPAAVHEKPVEPAAAPAEPQ